MTSIPDWRTHAACLGTNPTDWDLEHHGHVNGPSRRAHVNQLQRICGSCPVATQCLAAALTEPTYDTVRGEALFNASGAALDLRLTCGDCRKPTTGRRQRRYCPPCAEKRRHRRRPIAHGTEAGARRHYRRGEKPCQPCAAAARLAKKLRAAARPRPAEVAA